MVINTGKPDTTQDAPSHVPGINQGNSVGNYEKQVGHLADGKRTAAASTGINPSAHGPIDPRMPNLSPA
jgi:hypothetical protein